jgi:hypothetical protein
MPSTSAWRLRDTLTAAALFLATAAFTLWQNTRVAVLWDLSFLLDTSYRWSLGQLPYRDLPFPYAPLTFLLHTAIIKLLGRVYYPHILCAALEAGLATLLTWRILTSLLASSASLTAYGLKLKAAKPTNPSAQLATMLAAPLTVLGIYDVYPHPIYDSDCILAVLLALYLLQRAESRSPNADSRPPNAAIYARSALAGAACILPLFVKQNIGLPFLLISLAAVAAVAVTRSLRWQTLAPQLSFLAGAITTLAAALLTLHLTVGLHNYLYWTISFAAQRRLPSLSVILGIYNGPSLLWTIPAAIAALILLHRRGAGPIPRQMPGKMLDAPSIASFTAMGGNLSRSIAILLLAAPFLWTIFALTLTNDPSDRAGQLLSLWPHLLILSAALAVYNLRPSNLRADPTLVPFLPLILLATIHGAFLSQQLWGSTYAIWPLLTLLMAALLTQIPTSARPMAAIIAATFLICGSLYATSHERLSYIHLEETPAGPLTHATLPQLRGLTTPGPYIPAFEELVRFTDAEIPANDGILLIPGEVPFYFATGRAPQFPILLFDPATDPYTPQQTVDQARAHNIRWLIVTRNLQLTGPPHPGLPEIIRTLQRDFTLYRTLTNYDIYRHN